MSLRFLPDELELSLDPQVVTGIYPIRQETNKIAFYEWVLYSHCGSQLLLVLNLK